LLTARGLARTYPCGGGVGGVNLDLSAGEVVGLVGPNGSGKTTLARLLSTLTAPTAGSVAWFGESDRRSPDVRRRLGVVTDEPAHFEHLSGRQNVHFFAGLYGGGDVAAALTRFGLGEAADRPVREYSLGMRRRLALAEALVHRPDLLILDEPTLGLDHAGELDLLDELQAVAGGERSAIVATNDVALAERACTRVVFLHAGKPIREGPPAELLAELGATQEIELALAGAVDAQALAAVAGVQGVAPVAGGLRVLARRDVNPATVLAALDGTARLVTGMTIRKPDLGDLFLKLTGTALDR
jgi:ABC-2 type transport system ATP-binding protein